MQVFPASRSVIERTRSRARSIAIRAARHCAPFPFRRSVFIVAPPRSGSTLLYDCLRQFDEFLGLRHEADYIWWRLFPYDRHGLPRASDYVDATEVTRENAKLLRRGLYEDSVQSTTGKFGRMTSRLCSVGLVPISYLDKTIANCFHLAAIDRIFPNARFIFLVRDPRANISSMIEGWAEKARFGKPALAGAFAQLPCATIKHWSYPAPPGWQQVAAKPLAEICAWSWKQHVEAATTFFSNRTDVVRVRYESLLTNGQAVIKEIATALQMEVTDEVLKYVANPMLSRTSVSPPEKEKWKRINYPAIQEIIPQIRETATTIGYRIES